MPISGIIMPNMGSRTNSRISEAAALYASTSLSDALFTTTQQRVLGCLFGQPDRSFTVSELIQTTGAGSGAVQREVARLAGSGLLAMEPVGNQKRYRADPAAPIHAELVSIVRKTFGLVAPLREAHRDHVLGSGVVALPSRPARGRVQTPRHARAAHHGSGVATGTSVHLGGARGGWAP
jgi:hypothetical protein